MKYTYPVKDKFQARAVTEPDYEPNIFHGQNPLYVNLDQVRGTEFLQDLYYDLGIDETNQELEFTDDHVKIIFSGHRGCGKTTELKRIHHRLHHPKAYFSIFISLEEEMELSRFQPEDLYVLLILKLAEVLAENNIKVGGSSFKRLANRILSNEEVTNELNTVFNAKLETESGGGFDLLSLVKLKAVFKSTFGGESKSSSTIRREVKVNMMKILQDLNELLADIRTSLEKHQKGRDLLIIIDGSEKMRFDIYEQLFVKDANLLQSMAVNILISVPINAFYSIEKSPVEFTSQYIVPMIQLEKQNAMASFRKIIQKRMDTALFFENELVLDLCIEASGGCVRQLFRVVNTAIRKSRGHTITEQIAKTAIHELGSRMRELLDKEHLTLLKGKEYEPAEPKIKGMLFALVLLKYNGPNSIQPNPLLKGFIA